MYGRVWHGWRRDVGCAVWKRMCNEAVFAEIFYGLSPGSFVPTLVSLFDFEVCRGRWTGEWSLFDGRNCSTYSRAIFSTPSFETLICLQEIEKKRRRNKSTRVKTIRIFPREIDVRWIVIVERNIELNFSLRNKKIAPLRSFLKKNFTERRIGANISVPKAKAN